MTEIEADSNSSASGHSYNSSSYYSSSAETSDEEIAYVEQLVEENGKQEIVLIPATQESRICMHAPVLCPC